MLNLIYRMVEEEGTRILGVGVGLFLVILIWAAALSALVLISRLGSTLIGNSVHPDTNYYTFKI